MDISLPLDQTQCSYRVACSLISPTIVRQQNFPFTDVFSLKKKRCKFHFSRFSCSLLEQGLKPRPMLKPLKREENNFKNGGELEKPQLEGSDLGSGVCGQIEKLVSLKRYSEALELFEVVECESDIDVKSGTYDALVSACIGLKSIRGVKRVFKHMLKSEVDLDLYMMNRVLLMHVKCGMMIDARQLFDDMCVRNLVSWNTIIWGLVESGDYLEAFRLFLMLFNDVSDVGPRTFVMMIRASAGLGLISPGKQLHSCALKMGVSDVFISCTLIDMYIKCGNLEYARSVFDAMPKKTTVAWNSIIYGYGFHGYSEEALSMYYKMQDSGVKTDHYSYSIIVQVCTRLASFEHVKQAHAGLVRNGFGSDIVANTALVDFYSKWGRIEDARNVFDRMPQKNIISWNALLSGYSSNGCGTEAVELFEGMVHQGIVPNHVTFLAVLKACCCSRLSDRGLEIFESMGRDYKVKPRAMHYACMAELFGREGRLNDAFALIRDAPFKPTVNMWAALLTACRVNENFMLGKYAAQKLYDMGPGKLSNYVVLLNIFRSSGKSEEAAAVLQTLRIKGLRMLPSCTWIEIKKQQYVFSTGTRSCPENKKIYDNLDDVLLQISKHGYVPQGKDLLPDVEEREQSSLLHHSEKLAISFGLMSTLSLTPLQLVQDHRICNDCHNAVKLISMVYRRELVFRDASRFHHFKDGYCSCSDYW